MIYIYGIFDKEKAFYIGKAKNVFTRVNDHFHGTGNTTKGVRNYINFLLSKGEAPSVKILDCCTLPMANNTELYWIEYYIKNKHLILNAKGNSQNFKSFDKEYPKNKVSSILKQLKIDINNQLVNIACGPGRVPKNTDTPKAGKITIDLKLWTTPTQLAKELNVTKQVVNNWISRGLVEYKKIPELGLTILKRTNIPKGLK